MQNKEKNRVKENKKPTQTMKQKNEIEKTKATYLGSLEANQ